MVVANAEPLPRFNFGSSVVSARNIRMIRNSDDRAYLCHPRPRHRPRHRSSLNHRILYRNRNLRRPTYVSSSLSASFSDVSLPFQY